MINILIILIFLWGIIGFVIYAINYRDNFNMKQTIFLVLICGPFIWAICSFFIIGNIIQQRIEKQLDKLDSSNEASNRNR